MEHPKKRFSIFFPLLLIAAGVILLINMTGGLQGGLVNVLRQLWPLLLIAGGLDGLWRGDGYVTSIVWGGFGVVFLLSTLGVIVSPVLSLVLRLWPFMVLALGVQILLGRRTSWAWLAGIGAGLALVALMFLVALNPPAFNGKIETISQPLGEAAQVNIYLQPAVGTLEVSSGAAENLLVEGTAKLAEKQSLLPTYTLTDGKASYHLDSSDFSSTLSDPANEIGWDLNLTSLVPLQLDTDMGAGDQILDLTSLNIEGLKVNAGVGNITLTLPVDGNFIGTLNTAVGDVTIIVPSGASVNLTLNAALGSVNVPANFTRAGEAYRYGSSSRLVQLKVDTAVGNINVVVK